MMFGKFSLKIANADVNATRRGRNRAKFGIKLFVADRPEILEKHTKKGSDKKSSSARMPELILGGSGA